MARGNRIGLALSAVVLAVGMSVPAEVSAQREMSARPNPSQQVIDVFPKYRDQSGDLPGMSGGETALIIVGVAAASYLVWKLVKKDDNEAEESGDAENGAPSLVQAPRLSLDGQPIVPGAEKPQRSGAEVPIGVLMGLDPTAHAGKAGRFVLGLSIRH